MRTAGEHAGRKLALAVAQPTPVPLQMPDRQEADLPGDRMAILSALDLLTHGI